MIRLKPTRIALERDEALTTLLGIPQYDDYFQSLLIGNTEENTNHRMRVGTEGGTDDSDAETVVNHGSPSVLRVSSSSDGEDQSEFQSTPRIQIHDINPNQFHEGELGDNGEEEAENDILETEDAAGVEEGPGEDVYQVEQEVQEEESIYGTPLEVPSAERNYIHQSSTAPVESSPVLVVSSVPRQASQSDNPFSALLEMVTLPSEARGSAPHSRSLPRRRFFPIPVDSDSDDDIDRNWFVPRRFRSIEGLVTSAPHSPAVSGERQRWVQSSVRDPHVFEDLNPEAVSPSRQRSRFGRRTHRVRRRIRFTPEVENHNHAADERQAFVEAFNATGPDGQLLITPPRRPIQPHSTR